MDKRTLVKVSAGEHCIGFKTVSRQRKSPRTFLVTRDELVRLEQTPKIITQDIYCFAALRLNTATRTLNIDFSWLQSNFNSELYGWEETVVLPYDALMAFVQASAKEDGPKKWRVLSLQATMTPKIVFVDTERPRGVWRTESSAKSWCRLCRTISRARTA